MVKKNKYIKAAKKACQNVFKKEYKGILSLPFPRIQFLTPLDESYNIGKYYITIGNGWQINLNFGKLLLNIKDFSREVKVIVRHEIEHYRTCPFDLLTHFRMVNTALKTVNNKNISENIANQCADIIIDTKNFINFPEETIWSERNWIKAISKDNFKELPQSNKLMFLIKQALWKRKLVDEKNTDLLASANEIALVFLEGGLENRNTLTKKVEIYSKKLMEIFKEEDEEYFHRLIKGDRNSEGKGRELIVGNGKDVEEAINNFAQETTLENFNNVLEIIGFNFNKQEKRKIWYEQNAVQPIELSFEVDRNLEAEIAYPVTWRMSDPIETLDMVLTLQTSPVILPGITTKKWIKNETEISSIEKGKPDLLILIDSSGSMNWNEGNPSSPYHIALLSSFSLLKYYEELDLKVAGINFSDVPIKVKWTKEYEDMKNLFLQYQGGGTTYPISVTYEMINNIKGKKAAVILTDDELSNWKECQSFFINLLSEGHKILIFLIRKNMPDLEKYKTFINSGGRIWAMLKPEDVYNSVIYEL